MTSERVAVRCLVVVVALVALGCADFSRGAAPIDAVVDGATSDDATAAPTGDGPVSFAATVHIILTGACQGCHAQGQQAGDTQFLLDGNASADYAAAAKFVNTAAPGSSRLLAKMSGTGHGGGALFGTATAEYQTVLRWIQEGARP